MAAAGRRDVGDVPAAEALEQLAELGRLVLDLGDTVADTAGSRSRTSIRPVPEPGS